MQVVQPALLAYLVCQLPQVSWNLIRQEVYRLRVYEMIFGRRAIIYTILALGGLVLILYLGYLLMEADRLGRGKEEKFVLLAMACVIFFACISNLMIAIALTFGRVDEVVGRQSSATLYCDGKIVQRSVCIRWVNNLDFDNSDLNADQKIMIFLADWMPASCTESSFLLRKP